MFFLGKEPYLRNAKKNGVLYLEDSIEKKWKSHFFSLFGTKLYYTDPWKMHVENEDEGEGGELEPSDLSSINRLRDVSFICNIKYGCYRI